MNTLNLERIKLFSKLEIEQKHDKLNKLSCDCQSSDFKDGMADLVDKSFTEASNLSIDERSTLYYVSGYVARKENFISVENSIKLPESEFTDLVSRGKITHPPAALYDFAQ